MLVKTCTKYQIYRFGKLFQVLGAGVFVNEPYKSKVNEQKGTATT